MDTIKLRKQYTLPDGSIHTEKLLCDLSYWLDLAEEYHFPKKDTFYFLRHVLGDPQKFIEEHKNDNNN